MMGRSLVGLVVGVALLVTGPPISLAQSSGGGPDMTVDELVTQALRQNPELAAVRADVDAAVGRLRQAGLRPNPMLDLTGQQNASGPDNNVSVGLIVPLDLNGRKEGRIGVAEGELAIKRVQVAERERRLRAEVRLKAGEALAAARNVQVAGELLEVNRNALRLTQERVRTGAAPTLEESLLQVEVNRLDASRQMLASRLEVSRLQLKALVGLEPEQPLTLRGDLEGTDLRLERAEGSVRALAVRPDLQAARADVALARARVRKEEAEGRWDASVNVGYQRQETGFMLNGITDRGGTRPIQDVFHMVGGGLTITLPVRNRNQGNVQAAGAEVRAAEGRREFLELQVRQEVAAAFTQYEVARRSLALYARGVRGVARRNLDVVRQSQGLGRIPLLELIAEQRRYIEIEMGYTDALKQAWDGTVEVERAVGVGLR
ncbi:MAG: TolC family protein [Candidatus Rokuibacteriota bacterium]